MNEQHEPWAFLNGDFVPQSRARLTLHDAGFVMGATVTDLCRTFHQQLYRFAEHLRRFMRSCQLAHIDLLPAAREMTDWAEKLLALNRDLLSPGDELALVMFATPGPIGFYLGEPGGLGDAAPTLGMHTFPLPWPRYERLVNQGASLWVPDIRQVPPACVDPHIKHRSRLPWWLADREIHAQHPGSQALLLDQAGHVTETASANFLAVRQRVVLSPPLANILEGISLGVVRELCRKLGIPFEERPLTLADCLAAEEAMLTCTSYCLAGVAQLQGQALAFPGPIFCRLLQAWNEEAGLDIRGQILAGIAQNTRPTPK